MTIKQNALNGCCAARWFYDLGMAHGHPRYPNVEAFANAILDLGYSTVNVCVTNGSQHVEREYLEKLGFKAVPMPGSLVTHVGSAADIQKALQPFIAAREEKRKKEQEETRKKEVARQQKWLTDFEEVLENEYKNGVAREFTERSLTTFINNTGYLAQEQKKETYNFMYDYFGVGTSSRGSWPRIVSAANKTYKEKIEKRKKEEEKAKVVEAPVPVKKLGVKKDTSALKAALKKKRTSITRPRSEIYDW